MKKYRWPFIVGGAVLLLILGGSVALMRGAGSDSAADPTLSVALGETGPHIVRQNPIAGQRLPLSPVIDLTFDRSMDPRTTGSAWRFYDSTGEVISGTISWPESETLRFEPDRPLSPTSEYTGVVTTAAVARDGSSPGADIRLEFRTVDALAVGQVFPADGSQDVEIESAITVVFNRPIVALADVEDSAHHVVPIRISPPVAGSGEWVSTSVYVFTPESYLKSGIEYAVIVPAGLQDFSGETLAEKYVWRFATRAPEIADFALLNRAVHSSEWINDVLLDQTFIVTFLQPMKPESVSAALSITDAETGVVCPIQQTWNETNTMLTFRPVNLFQADTKYHLTLAKSAEAESGGALREGLNVALKTVPLPRIRHLTSWRSDIFDPSRAGLEIAFSTPMDEKSLQNHVKISPLPVPEPRFEYDS
ncbi:MAG: Ig-like domain-containing protein, partial [Anaerolineales bacterium]